MLELFHHRPGGKPDAPAGASSSQVPPYHSQNPPLSCFVQVFCNLEYHPETCIKVSDVFLTAYMIPFGSVCRRSRQIRLSSGPYFKQPAHDNDLPWPAAVKCYQARCYGKTERTRLLRCNVLFRFGGCTFDTRAYALSRDGESKRLTPKVFQVLNYLLIHRERVVTKQELSEQIWPDLFVSDSTLESTISAVRRAVGDSGRAQRMIRTLPGHGYQFIHRVEVDSEAEEPEPAQPPLPVTPPIAAHAPSPGPDPGGERKLVTVFCCALGLPAAGPLQLDLDTLYDIMQALYDVVQHVVQPYGGTLQPAIGEHLIAIFGAPVAHEDHAQRAVLAAFELNRLILEDPNVLRAPSGEALALRTGLCTGLVAVRGMSSVSAALVVSDWQDHLAGGVPMRAGSTGNDSLLREHSPSHPRYGMGRSDVLARRESGGGRGDGVSRAAHRAGRYRCKPSR